MEGNYQKKIEKIAQAIYLVSNHLKDSEPLKWELRRESICFLSCIRSLSEDGGDSAIPADMVIDALSTSGRDLDSLISLAVISGLISRTNGSIITNEISSLLVSFKELVTENTAKAGFILSEDFFSADPELQQRLSLKIDKGQNLPFLSDKVKTFLSEKLNSGSDIESISDKYTNTNRTKNEHNVIKDKKDSRQTQILHLLKNRSNLTIKDFVGVINNCSEKTIQRELIELVDKGIIKREGERRWSTYSLK